MANTVPTLTGATPTDSTSVGIHQAMSYTLTHERRAEYRRTTQRSNERKRLALVDGALEPVHPVNTPRFDPKELMPQIAPHGLRALSMFTGGGGLDLGFERAGFTHAAAYEILDICGETLAHNRPDWNVFAGAEGDVRKVDWRQYRSEVDLLHGGPPCQPFSVAGHQRGEEDERNMWPSFIKAVLAIRPRVFVAENVPGLLNPKFKDFVEQVIEAPLKGSYKLHRFIMQADRFGVPQTRKRVLIIGFRNATDHARYVPPAPTHTTEPELMDELSRCIGVREALGLPDIGMDGIAPTLRSGFTGPRSCTGVVNSKASMVTWGKLEVWPNGVQRERELASNFPPENGHFRMSVQDCALLQGFPADWTFKGAVYQQLGQIGNSVCPPVAYHVARSILAALA